MTFQGIQDFPCGHVPDFDRLVTTPRSQFFAVGAKSHTIDPTLMTFQGIYS